MIIGVCGFGSTGSSAVSDLLKEFDENQLLDDHEFILPYFPDGILDLDLHINKNNAKYYSYVAIDRFRRFAKEYHKVFENEKSTSSFIELTDEYLNQLIQVRWVGTSNADWIDLHSKLKKIVGYSINMARLIPIIEKVTHKNCNIFPNHELCLSVEPDNFVEITKTYILNVLKNMGADFNKNIVLDQPFPGNNPELCFDYFDEPRAIVVDRDPRDQYLFAKKFLLHNGRYIPTDDVNSFIVYYKTLRKNLDRSSNDNKNIMYLKFEDLVYEYNDVLNRLMKFCNLKQHTKKRMIFEPEMSINNTQVFRRYPELSDDIKIIERELPEYLYPFEDYKEVPERSGKMFFGKSPLNK